MHTFGSLFARLHLVVAAKLVLPSCPPTAPARPRHRRRPSAVVLRVAAATALAVTLASCGVGGTPAPGRPAQPLRVGFKRPIKSLSPLSSSLYDLQTLGIVEMLGRPKDDGSAVEPNLLSAWEQVDPSTWKLTVRDGVTFQDGKKVDARAVADAVAMTESANQGRSDSIATGKLSVSGPMQLALTTASPTTEVPWDLSDPTLYPIFDAAAIAAAGTDPAKLVASGALTGPWIPQSFTPEKLTFTRNDHYWRGRPRVPGLEIDIITDPQARVAALQNGEIDIDIAPPANAYRTLTHDSRMVYRTAPGTTVNALALFNTTLPPYDSSQIRKAIVLGTDYAELAKAAGGSYIPATGLYPKSEPFSIVTQSYDPAAAGQLLDAAGWTKGPDGRRAKDGKPLTLVYVFSPAQIPSHADLGIALKDSLGKLGIDVQLRSVEDPYDAANRGTDWNLTVVGTNAEGDADPVSKSVGVFLASKAPYNFAGVSDPAVDAALDALSTTLDPQRRLALDRQFLESVARGSYALSLGFTALDALVSPSYRAYRVPFDPGYIPWDIGPSGTSGS